MIKFGVLFLVVLLSIISTLSQAQHNSTEKKNYYSIGASAQYGALLGYKETDPVIIFTHPFCIETTIKKISTGKERWERIYNYPSKAYSFAYYNYGLPHDYGEAYSATASYDFNLLRRRRKNVWLTTGIGLVYSTKKYNAEHNPYNKAISTDISYVLQGSLKYDYNLSEKFILNTSFSFRHFSNATLGIPNNGMNFPLVGLGITYVPHKPSINYVGDTIKSFDKTIHFNLSSGLAIKKVLKIDEVHKIFTVSLYADRAITKYNTILIGLDGFYNNSLSSEFVKRGLYKDDSEIDHRQIAITFGQELFIGKIGVLTQGGIFLYQPHNFGGKFYQKYGVKYHLTKDVFLGSIVKVYIGTADYMEWVLGLRL